MFVSFISSLPIAMYFIGVQAPLSFIGLLPVLFLLLTVAFYTRLGQLSS